MIGDLLNKLEKVKGSKGRWTACCPAHGDKSPSLAITETDDGRILLKCFAGCSAHQVVEAVGMDLTDLFPNDNNINYLKEQHFNKPVRRPFYATDSGYEGGGGMQSKGVPGRSSGYSSQRS